MGSEGNAVQLGNGEVKLVKLEESCVNLEAKDVVKHTPSLMKPVFPDALGEGIHVPSDFTSPSTVLNLPPELACVDAHRKVHSPGSPDASSPVTPKDGSFDPFAPGIGELMMAPRGSRRSQETRSSSARSLKFGSSVKRFAFEEDCESDEEIPLAEERLLEFLYADLLEVIVSTQVYSIQHGTCLDEVLVKHVILDGFKTPEPLLTGIADTCPPAPVRLARTGGMNFDRGLCKKLDFEH